MQNRFEIADIYAIPNDRMFHISLPFTIPNGIPNEFASKMITSMLSKINGELKFKHNSQEVINKSSAKNIPKLIQYALQ